MPFLRRHYVGLLALVALPVLASCGLFITPKSPPPPQKHAHAAKPKAAEAPEIVTYQPEQYVLNLSLAKLSFDNPSADATSPPNLDAVSAYASQAPEAKPPRLHVVILEFKTVEAGAQQVAVPINTESNDFPDLLDVVNRLDRASYILQDIHPALITVTNADRQALLNSSQPPRELVDTQLKHLLEHAEKLPRLDDVAIQLKLTRFFLTQQRKDPAYLAMENAKRTLAAASTRDKDKARVAELSAQMDAVDSQLRQEMPY